MAPDFQLCQHVFSHSKLDATCLSSTGGLGFIPGTVPFPMPTPERSGQTSGQTSGRREENMTAEGNTVRPSSPAGGPPRRKNPGAVRVHPKGDPPPGGSDTETANEGYVTSKVPPKVPPKGGYTTFT